MVAAELRKIIIIIGTILSESHFGNFVSNQDRLRVLTFLCVPNEMFVPRNYFVPL